VMEAHSSNQCMEVDGEKELFCHDQEQSNSSSSNAECEIPAACTSKGKGKGQGLPPPAAKGKGRKGPPPCPTKGKGKGRGPRPPTAKAKGKGKLWPWPEAKSVAQPRTEAVSDGPPVCVVARLMDGREFDLQLRTSDLGLAVKQQVSHELGISASRLKLVVGSNLLRDLTTLHSFSLADGDAITVIILSPLQGSLTRSGLDVPIDVLEMKMALHDVLEARGRLVQAL